MKQVCIIHGGSTFVSDQDYLDTLRAIDLKYERMLYGRRWKDWIGQQLEGTYELVLPEMPNKSNAKYEEWSLFFDKVIRFLNPDATLVGHSLGGIFLVKYLNEHPEYHFDKIALIAAPFDDASTESLASFMLPPTIATFITSTNEQALFHSRDDKVVPFAESEKYLSLLPNATLYMFDTHGHFNIKTFPELLTFIQK